MKVIAITCALFLCTSCHSNSATIVTNSTATTTASTTTASTATSSASPAATTSTSPVTATTLTKWTAISSTAMGVTGDIEVSPDTLVIAGHHFAMHPVRALSSTEISDAASLFSTKVNTTSTGSLTQILIPQNAALLHGNTACGRSDVTWLVTLMDHTKSGNDLWIAMFSGSQQPDLTPSVLAQSTALCGTYWYQQLQK